MLYFCRVKLLTTIFSVYILILSALPCCETGDCTGKKELSVSVSFADADHGDEACTPFCACACCSFQFSKTCNCIKLKSPEFFAVYHSTEINLQLSEIYLPIWQPPQLS
jgi:hypothetical protein